MGDLVSHDGNFQLPEVERLRRLKGRRMWRWRKRRHCDFKTILSENSHVGFSAVLGCNNIGVGV